MRTRLELDLNHTDPNSRRFFWQQQDDTSEWFCFELGPDTHFRWERRSQADAVNLNEVLTMIAILRSEG